MALVVWTVGAKADLTRHYDALVGDAPDAAVKAVQAIVKAGDSLQQSPQRGTIIQQAAGLRKLPVRFGKVGFVMHYVILDEDVVILRIYQGREQRPV
jgi:plasmid stabilization system protein ParE